MKSRKPAPNRTFGTIDSKSSPGAGNARNTLRRAGIAAREALSAAEHRTLSLALEAHLDGLLKCCRPRVLGFCWPFRAEFDCRPLVARMLATDAGLRACLPVVSAPGQPMFFRAWLPDSAMAVDRYGIHYPESGDDLTPDVLLMPVNAFDALGYRLGYGAGYFDRTLAALVPPPLAIGIGFELARVASIAPESHDVPLDAVVTEAGIDIFSPRIPKAYGTHK